MVRQMSADDLKKKSITLLRDKHAQYIASFEKVGDLLLHLKYGRLPAYMCPVND